MTLPLHKTVTLDDILALAREQAKSHGPGLAALRASGVPLNAGNVPMISEGYLALLLPGLRKVWTEGLSEDDPTFMRSQFFPSETSQRSKETFQGIGELGSEAWVEFEKTGRLPYDGFNVLWPYELSHHEFALGMMIKRKLIEDNLYPDGLRLPRDENAKAAALGRSAAVFRERAAVALLNYAFVDTGVDPFGRSVVGPDGVGLISAAHKRSPSDATTQSNEFNLSLTGPNLNTVRMAMNAFTDDKGQLAPSHPTELWIPPGLEDRAHEIMDSDKDPTSANNTVNTNKGRYTIKVWHWLDASAPDRWFLVDPVKKRQHLIWLDRILPEFDGTVDWDTYDHKFKGYQRFSLGWSHWTWIAGSDPTP